MGLGSSVDDLSDNGGLEMYSGPPFVFFVR